MSTETPAEAAKAAAKLREICETATRLGYELGRKEAGEEIATALERPTPQSPDRKYVRIDHAAAVARSLTSQPSGAASEPLAASTGHSDLPEDARPPQEPSHPLPDRAPVVDLVGRLRDAVDAARERRLNPSDLTKGGQ